MPPYLSLLLLSLLLGHSAVYAQRSETKLQKGDRIAISIGGVDPNEVSQISKVYTISDSGTISMLHIKEVKAVGMTPSELQSFIEKAYVSQEYYTNPVVTVSIDSATQETDRVVYVSGVITPGPKPFKPGLTAMQSIMSGGGPTPYGSLKKTRVVRTNPDGTRQTIAVDLSKYSSNPAVDIQLQPEDQVIVPE